MLVLHGLLQDLAAQLQDEQMRFDKESKAMQGKAAEVRMVFTLQACVPPAAFVAGVIQREAGRTG